MKVIFTGDPTEIERGESLSRLKTEIYGKVFPMRAEVDVSDLDPKLQAKLMHNPHFRVAGVDAPAAPLIIPASAEPAPEAAEEAPATSPRRRASAQA